MPFCLNIVSRSCKEEKLTAFLEWMALQKVQGPKGKK